MQHRIITICSKLTWLKFTIFNYYLKQMLQSRNKIYRIQKIISTLSSMHVAAVMYTGYFWSWIESNLQKIWLCLLSITQIYKEIYLLKRDLFFNSSIRDLGLSSLFSPFFAFATHFFQVLLQPLILFFYLRRLVILLVKRPSDVGDR